MIAAALARRNGFADQRLRQRHQPAATESLQHARRGQPVDGRRQGAEHGAGHENHERHEHHAPAAERIAEAPVDRSGDGVGDQIGHHHPGHPLDTAEARGDGRQRGGDDGLIRHRHKHRQHDRRKDRPEQRSGRGRRARLGCGLDAGRRVGCAARNIFGRRMSHADIFLRVSCSGNCLVSNHMGNPHEPRQRHIRERRVNPARRCGRVTRRRFRCSHNHPSPFNAGGEKL